MKISRESRERWERETKEDAFNQWMNSHVIVNGEFSLDRMYEIAKLFDIKRGEYDHLNDGQQRMNVGNRLRATFRKLGAK